MLHLLKTSSSSLPLLVGTQLLVHAFMQAIPDNSCCLT